MIVEFVVVRSDYLVDRSRWTAFLLRLTYRSVGECLYRVETNGRLMAIVLELRKSRNRWVIRSPAHQR